ncbi:hypothetical protein [Amycolatopsis sp. FDAARGOS 1241]|uniref:hypothetical protein n=1 Tax=Amycolatopsis sp. FDAARGOS 1241 TaxID=2778070 RepID=UPI001950F9F7|nr:hypothetical protein [Amycolatopsis sp. FDAARGOS 1241]QRP50227.1 hypothetical protein I6J71_22540 [Amycolatopsis sp. FDAARGOS 1241]
MFEGVLDTPADVLFELAPGHPSQRREEEAAPLRVLGDHGEGEQLEVVLVGPQLQLFGESAFGGAKELGRLAAGRVELTVQPFVGRRVPLAFPDSDAVAAPRDHQPPVRGDDGDVEPEADRMKSGLSRGSRPAR